MKTKLTISQKKERYAHPEKMHRKDRMYGQGLLKYNLPIYQFIKIRSVIAK